MQFSIFGQPNLVHYRYYKNAPAIDGNMLSNSAKYFLGKTFLIINYVCIHF